MKVGKIILLCILGLALLIGLDFGFGFLGVFKTKTVGKAQENARREVFEQSQSYVEGKRIEATKMYKEWYKAPADEKAALESMAGHTFANVEETIFEEPLRTWVHNCKYGISNSPTYSVSAGETSSPFK